MLLTRSKNRIVTRNSPDPGREYLDPNKKYSSLQYIDSEVVRSVGKSIPENTRVNGGVIIRSGQSLEEALENSQVPVFVRDAMSLIEGVAEPYDRDGFSFLERKSEDSIIIIGVDAHKGHENEDRNTTIVEFHKDFDKDYTEGRGIITSAMTATDEQTILMVNRHQERRTGKGRYDVEYLPIPGVTEIKTYPILGAEVPLLYPHPELVHCKPSSVNPSRVAVQVTIEVSLN